MGSSHWMSDAVQHQGRGWHGCVGNENGMTGSGLAQKPMRARLQPENLLQAGAGLRRLPLPSAPVRRTQHLSCVLVHVVCVARRLRGCEEGERVRRRGGGGEGVDGRVRGVGHRGGGARA